MYHKLNKRDQNQKLPNYQQKNTSLLNIDTCLCAYLCYIKLTVFVYHIRKIFFLYPNVRDKNVFFDIVVSQCCGMSQSPKKHSGHAGKSIKTSYEYIGQKK